MFNTRQTVLASRPAAMVLALTLVAALSTPFVLLSRAHADPSPPAPPPCAEGNNNGCTELSSIPPEVSISVPPNIVLMLDDSGSMAWDYMPDWGYLSNSGPDGVRNSAINGVYYDPTVVYTPPPQADSTAKTPDLYPDSPDLTGAYLDGFTDTTTTDVRTYSASKFPPYGDADFGHAYPFGNKLQTTQYDDTGHDYGPAVWGGGSPGSPGGPGSPGYCPGGYHQNPGDPTQCIRDPVATIGEIWTCNPGDTYYANHAGEANQCRHRERTEHGWVDTWYNATDRGPKCPSGSSYNSSDNLCHYPPQPWVPPTPPTDPIPPTPNYKWICPSGGSPDPADAPPPPSDPPPAGYVGPECKSTTRTYTYVWAFTYVVGAPIQRNEHYVIPNGPDAPSGGWCANLYYAWQKANCVDATDTSGTAAPSSYKDADGATQYYLAQDGTRLTAGQNIANWFSYYRTRMLMAKSSLMTAFLPFDARYRFGFGSINANGVGNIPSSPTPYSFDDAISDGSGGSASNKLAVVQPFGNGSDSSSQKARFWTWLANESPNNGTPLRKALQAVGEYYKTSQPWSTLPGDPGYATGSDAKFACRASYTILTTDGFWNGDPPSPSVGNADNTPSGPYTVPSGALTGYTPRQPYQDNQSDTLADVAMYYWQHDLQPGPDWPNEVSHNNADPATWQHMTTYTIGLGFQPPTGREADGSNGIMPAGTTIPQIFAWAQTPPGPSIAGFSWPSPSSNSLNNIADLAHAAVNGHGGFFSATDPQKLADAIGKITSDIGSRSVAPTPAAVNASVVSQGAVSFSTGYDTKDWSGGFEAVTLKPDGTIDQVLWLDGNDPDHTSVTSTLDAQYHVSFASSGDPGRKVYTDSYKVAGGGTATFSAFQFTTANEASLDTTENSAGEGLQSPALSSTDTNDTLDHRIQYLLGDSTYEGTTYRTRSSIMGAILRAAPVYISGATGNYYDSWPTLDHVSPPETAAGAQTYDQFVSWASSRKATVYQGANDGMLHAFNTPVPTCASFDPSTGACSGSWSLGTDAGKEDWAFIPRAVYANLGNLTVASGFSFRRTVDATPVTRDVFFSEGGAGNNKWHTILAGGVGLGGRGVYALDVTDPTVPDFGEHPMTKYPASGVLWEFDSDMTAKAMDCVSIVGDSESGTCKTSDLGFTVSQPNVARLSNGEWVVLVPNGYFPDCTTPDIPTADQASCNAVAADAPRANPADPSSAPYSALFVLDAQTGKLLAELKTPTGIALKDGRGNVTSFGLATPVVGDYQNDQVDDVAFAGDVQGNMWRFNLSGDPSTWTVTLAYQGNDDGSGHQGLQPITTMPHLFPDPTTNRFMVLFGTGKYLGAGDNNVDSTTPIQSIYGVRDQGSDATSVMAYSQSDLAPRYLHETSLTLSDGTTATLRCVTSAADGACDTTSSAASVGAAGTGGWYIDLHTTTSDGTTNDSGERVVVNPGAIFSSNTVVFETLITGSASTDACNPSTQGAILALNAITGGTAGASSLGGGNIAGGRINNARTSGSLPLVSSLGGGQALFPGMTLSPGKTPISIDAPIWRRRSWNEINQDQ